MMGEALGNSARYGNDKYVGIAVVFSRKGDHGAIGRKDGIGFNAGSGRQAGGVSAISVDGPQIAGVRKNNRCAIEGRPLQQRMRSLSGKEKRAKRSENCDKERADRIHFSCSVGGAGTETRISPLKENSGGCPCSKTLAVTLCSTLKVESVRLATTQRHPSSLYQSIANQNL